MTLLPAAGRHSPSLFARLWRHVTPGRVLALSAIAALVVFSGVQERIVRNGIQSYVTASRESAALRRRPPAMDTLMQPAIHESYVAGLTWGGGVLIAGLAGAGMLRWSRHRA